jgi:Uma2 family endonuclease
MQPVVFPVAPDWVPTLLYRLTLEQYEGMIASGVLTERDRVQLINGYLVRKMSESPRHGAITDGLRMMLEAILFGSWYIRPDKPLRIASQVSVPEPDLAVVRGRWQDYVARYPEPSDTALVVEVSSSSLAEDRAMTKVYGPAGIPVYWIVNLVDRQVEVYSDPGPSGYASRNDYLPGQQVPVVIDGQQLGTIAVDVILP